MQSERKKRSEPADSFLTMKKVIYAMVAVLLLILIVLGYLFGKELFTEEGISSSPESAKEYTIVIQDKETTLQVGNELQSKGIIRSALVFAVQSKLYRTKFTAGTYTVNSHMSSKAILKYFNTEYEKLKDTKEK